QVGGAAHRPQAIGKVAKAVLEKANDAVVELCLDGARQRQSQAPVHGVTRFVVAAEEEGKIDDAKFDHPIRDRAAPLVAQGQLALFDEPEDVFGAVALVHDVPDIGDGDGIAEFGSQTVSDQFQAAAERGGGGAVATHADGNWMVHGSDSAQKTYCRGNL